MYLNLCIAVPINKSLAIKNAGKRSKISLEGKPSERIQLKLKVGTQIWNKYWKQNLLDVFFQLACRKIKGLGKNS